MDAQLTFAPLYQKLTHRYLPQSLAPDCEFDVHHSGEEIHLFFTQPRLFFYFCFAKLEIILVPLLLPSLPLCSLWVCKPTMP